MMNSNVFGGTIIQPLTAIVRFSTAASANLLSRGTVKTAFQDGVGQSAAGGYPLWTNDATITQGQVPANQAWDLQAMSLWVARNGAGASAVPSSAELLALGSNIQLSFNYAGQPYQLGRLLPYIGPVGNPNISNVMLPNRIGWPWMQAEDGKGFIIEANQSFTLSFTVQADVTAGVATSIDYDVYIHIPAAYIARGPAAVKQ